MKIQEKLHALLNDPAVARRIRNEAEASLDAELSSPAGVAKWKALLKEFNVTPAELHALTTPVAPGTGTVTSGIPTRALAIANGTTSSAVCTTTTTTTIDLD
jgi:hypothetical protein